MKSKKIFFVIIGILLVGVSLIITDWNKTWNKNERLLSKEILAIPKDVEEVNLSEIVQFEWNEIYAFQPYMPRESIYEVIGYKWDNIDETVSEGMNQIVFTKDDKVVCYLYGYPENNRYGFNFDNMSYNDGYIKLNSKDDNIFKIIRYEDTIYLTK